MVLNQNPRDASSLYNNTTNLERASLVLEQSQKSSFTQKPECRGISVVILNKDKPERIVPLLQNLERQKACCAQAGIEIQILVGDTGSTDPKVLEFYDAINNDCSITKELDYHFSKCNNLIAFTKARCENVLFLKSNIVFPSEDTPLLRMYEYISKQPSTGVLGTYLWHPDGSVSHAGMDFFLDKEKRVLSSHPFTCESLVHNALNTTMSAAAVTGACLLIPSHLFELVGGFNDRYNVECQDIDLCFSVRRLGFQCECMNIGHVIYGENSECPEDAENSADWSLFLRRWRSFVEAGAL
jgi:GT2 family glycosyltransferase